MNFLKNITFITLASLSSLSPAANTQGPLQIPLCVQPSIGPAAKGKLGFPKNWLYAHIKCSVSNNQDNDRFSIVDTTGFTQSVNESVDGQSMGSQRYFALSTPGTHYFDFDVFTFGNPIKSLYIINGSSESLEFSDCTAEAE